MSRHGWVPSEWFRKYADTVQVSYLADGSAHSTVVLLVYSLLDVLPKEYHDHAKIEVAASRIYVSSIQGIEAEQPRNAPATANRTEEQLQAMVSRCNDLVQLLDRMNSPATTALFREGVDIRQLARTLREAAETARCAYGEYSIGPAPNGRPKKYEAAFVTESTALAYESITGRCPTFTTDPMTAEITGLWPDLLRATFQVLKIEASVPSQVASYRDRSRQRE